MSYTLTYEDRWGNLDRMIASFTDDGLKEWRDFVLQNDSRVTDAMRAQYRDADPRKSRALKILIYEAVKAQQKRQEQQEQQPTQ